MTYERYERGQLNTTSYRCYIKNSETNKLVSPFHDIPLFANKENQVYNAVIEIPRWSNAKMEISKKEKLNPITQDVKKNKLRFVNNCFPHHGYIWNYGALPQTWEDPNVKDETTGCNGDNDPLDVCEIGSKVHQRGSVVQIKVLGALGLIDEGEADWKIICIDINDPLAAKLNDITDVETHCPGLLDSTRDWFKIYKIPTGKPANSFAENGKFFNREFAINQINHDYKLWLNLVQGGYDKSPEKKEGLSLENTSLDYSPSNRLTAEEASNVINQASENFNPQAAQIDQVAIDAVSYIDRSKYN
ncbi:inorganic pyrophosphatase isoform X1 [Brachionus plicatilis]|uniref:Inorganic pyrophosphatase n=1 Tax=Brachionus plicatilis TaxID=10195 RepID=A0A3M7PWT7_BRAPC|nr:inorganic pyrophosphatase isoform X1 [Brachionus plicatilis]